MHLVQLLSLSLSSLSQYLYLFFFFFNELAKEHSRMVEQGFFFLSKVREGKVKRKTIFQKKRKRERKKEEKRGTRVAAAGRRETCGK